MLKVDKKKCNGCMACKSICPVSAITMVDDNEGFKYPSIDENICIECGLCNQACSLNKKKHNQLLNKVFICKNLDYDIRINSSSGGIFSILAKKIIESGGSVFGAKFNEQFQVQHVEVSSKDCLYMLRGSKYVQSDINDTYKQTKKILDKGKTVLFTGTPCQIGGLKSYLRKDYEKLYTQDFICHGVPSPKVWQNYLKYINDKENIGDIKRINFRNKENGWNKFNIEIQGDNKYLSPYFEDEYMKAFLNNISLRKSCYNCLYKGKSIVSDLTLGDCWGINKIMPEFNDDKGTSVVIINSEKGKKLFNDIKHNIEFIDIAINEVIKYNSALIKSVKYEKNREKFLSELDSNNFAEALNKYLPKKSIKTIFIIKFKNIIKKNYRKNKYG